MNIQCKQHKDYLSSLRTLNTKGGKYKKAVQKSNHIEKVFQYDLENTKKLNTTKHGESRIQHCIKYELAGRCRLITIQNKHIVLFCFLGTHEDVDRWIEQHRGSTLVGEKGKISLIQKSEDIYCTATRVTGDSALAQGFLYKKLSSENFDVLLAGLNAKTTIALSDLESTHQEDDIYSIVKSIEDKNKVAVIYDVFSLLRQNKIEEANKRIKLFLGEIQEIKTLTDHQIEALIDGDQIKQLATDDPHYSRIFNHYIQTASYMDWMLFLNSEQEKIVNKDFSGIAKLLGISGSGKTCIVIRRAIRLAEKYTAKNILIITLNRSLARLISNLVDYAALPEIRHRIEVKAFFEVCQFYLYQFEPNNKKIYDDITWKSEEHIDVIWREYYRCELNNNDASVLLPVHDYLIAKSIHAEAYIREEFDWIRSAASYENRKDYLNFDRKGRSYRLEKKYRANLLKGLTLWEKKMKAVGVTDYLGLSCALEPYTKKLKAEYRCILVDESQDFGTTELALIRKLVPKNENDLFFSGDAAQKVSCKHQLFAKAGVATHKSRTYKILKNYRNSREILEFSNNVLSTHVSNKKLISDEFELLNPEYANVNGATPLVLEGQGLAHEITSAYAYMQTVEVIGDNKGKKGCIAICGYSLYEIEQYAKQYNIPVLNGETCIAKDNLYLSDLEQTKGFEFDYVCILNCNAHIIPNYLKPEKEQLTDLAQLYVAMTRAKLEVVISFSDKLSNYISLSDQRYYLEDTWSSYIDTAKKNFSSPEKFDTFTPSDNKIKIYGEMTFNEFLYTKDALGLSSIFIKKIRSSVKKYKTLSDLVNAWETSPSIKRKFRKEILYLKKLINNNMPSAVKYPLPTILNRSQQHRKNKELKKSIC